MFGARVASVVTSSSPLSSFMRKSHISIVWMYFLFPQMERWIFEHICIPVLGYREGAYLSGSEVNSFDQCSFQGNGKLIECVQDAGEGVHGSSVPQQSTFFVRPCCQVTLCQQGEPMREKPVPAKKNGSVINNCSINAWWSSGSNWKVSYMATRQNYFLLKQF